MNEAEEAARDNAQDDHMYVKILPLDAVLNAAAAVFQKSFWANIRKTSPNKCWEWQAKLSHGYGRFTFQHKRYLAHRIAFTLFHGQNPKRFVLHTCDNPKCCNPQHLYEGSQNQNTADRIRRGREARGEQHGCSKLTATQVREMRRLHFEDGMSCRGIGRMFLVHNSTANRIIKGSSWRHALSSQECEKLQQPRRKIKLSQDQVDQIRARLCEAESLGHIARVFGVHKSTILDIKTGRTWRQEIST